MTARSCCQQWIAFKLELAFDFHVGHNHGQHLFMNVDFPLSYTASFPPGRERRACCGYLDQARGLSPLPQGKDNDAQLFAQTCTLRIRQVNSFDFSIVRSTSQPRTVAILPLLDFHEISRAAGPKRQVRRNRLAWSVTVRG
jgi:hypothetical protein